MAVFKGADVRIRLTFGGADVRIRLTFGFLATNECWNRMMKTIHIILLITDLEAVLCRSSKESLMLLKS